MKSVYKTTIPLVGAVLLSGFIMPVLNAAPPLREFPTVVADTGGHALQSAMIWTDAQADQEGVAVAFRKTFELPKRPAQATLSLFADARYILWVNGTYVDRGPARFQPNGPQYDVFDLAQHLQAGRNAVVVLVVGNLSGGKIMRHRPGLTARLEIDGRELLRTDSSWKWSDATRYRKIIAGWADLGETEVDTRVEDGDWTQLAYNDAGWKSSTPIAATSWGALTRRNIALMREQAVPVDLLDGVTLPVTLEAGKAVKFDTRRIVQAYPVLEFTADEGTELSIEPYGVKYLARPGSQLHFTLDTRGITNGSITVKTGRITLTGFKMIERLYPFDRVGSFHSNDEFLNKLWALCARAVEVLSEDAYVDCADRERVEWMDCDPPAWDMNRVAMSAPDANGKPVFSDARLLGAMVRRTALTIQPEGYVKAHTCSDRYDTHAKMEDRCAEWVAGIRRYYEATGDAALVREIWPAVTTQMDFFLALRTERGLVRSRDWVVWGNPVGYANGEGTTLNVFVQRSLVDTALLAHAIGEKNDEVKYKKAADELASAINTVLWDERTGGYFSGYFADADVTERAPASLRSLARVNNRTEPTLHSNLFALDRGVVPPDRRARVLANVLAQSSTLKGGQVMIYHYLAQQLYEMDRHENDQRVLALWRDNWGPMVRSRAECTWESIDGSSSIAHIYGLFPGAHLSRSVLGVRRDAPVADKVIVIEPHLGDLTLAEGTVVTEFGLVPVSWKSVGDNVEFNFTVPAGVNARLRLPAVAGSPTNQLNGKPILGTPQAGRLESTLKPGRYEGRYASGQAIARRISEERFTAASTLGPEDSNMALRGTASQSSIGYEGAVAARAIDGNTDGIFFNNSVTHTGSDKNAWWQVDLGANCIIKKIKCFNRTDADSGRAADYDIKIGTDGSTWTTVLHQAEVMGTPTEIKAGGVTGRYVRIQLRGSNVLTLAEVEVWGRPVSAAGAKAQENNLK